MVCQIFKLLLLFLKWINGCLLHWKNEIRSVNHELTCRFLIGLNHPIMRCKRADLFSCLDVMLSMSCNSLWVVSFQIFFLLWLMTFEDVQTVQVRCRSCWRWKWADDNHMYKIHLKQIHCYYNPSHKFLLYFCTSSIIGTSLVCVMIWCHFSTILYAFTTKRMR